MTTPEKGMQSLVAAVERDEAAGTKFHSYRAKLAWVLDRARHYSEHTGMTPEAVLAAWESRRNYWYMNYYQECNQPRLGGRVRVFDTVDDLRAAIGDQGFRCPRCGQVSKSPYACDSGAVVELSEGRTGPCDWKVYGLLRDLGKGVSVCVRADAVVETMFMPVAWEPKCEVTS